MKRPTRWASSVALAVAFTAAGVALFRHGGDWYGVVAGADWAFAFDVLYFTATAPRRTSGPVAMPVDVESHGFGPCNTCGACDFGDDETAATPTNDQQPTERA